MHFPCDRTRKTCLRRVISRRIIIPLTLVTVACVFGLAGCATTQALERPASSTVGSLDNPTSSTTPVVVGLAVEFTDHAAAAYVAMDKGLFSGRGLNVSSFTSYVTGTELAAALARGDIQAAYMCLVPAINVRANGGVPVKVVSGTHLYGYALVVNPDKVTALADLGEPNIKVGCVQPGAATDVLLQRLCQNEGLPTEDIFSRLQRMNPPMLVLALKAGTIDACLLPEHWATVAESEGFRILTTAQEIWPGMIGSVLVVKEDMIRDHPSAVAELVQVTRDATEWIQDHPEETASIVTSHLQATAETVLPEKAAEAASKLAVTPELIKRSMSRLEYRTDLDPPQVQATIDFMNELGYLKRHITVEEILEQAFLNAE